MFVSEVKHFTDIISIDHIVTLTLSGYGDL